MVRKMKFEEDYDYIIEKLNGIEQDIEFLKNFVHTLSFLITLKKDTKKA